MHATDGGPTDKLLGQGPCEGPDWPNLRFEWMTQLSGHGVGYYSRLIQPNKKPMMKGHGHGHGCMD